MPRNSRRTGRGGGGDVEEVLDETQALRAAAVAEELVLSDIAVMAYSCREDSVSKKHFATFFCTVHTKIVNTVKEHFLDMMGSMRIGRFRGQY